MRRCRGEVTLQLVSLYFCVVFFLCVCVLRVSIISLSHLVVRDGPQLWDEVSAKGGCAIHYRRWKSADKSPYQPWPSPHWAEGAVRGRNPSSSTNGTWLRSPCLHTGSCTDPTLALTSHYDAEQRRTTDVDPEKVPVCSSLWVHLSSVRPVWLTSFFPSFFTGHHLMGSLGPHLCDLGNDWLYRG